MRGCYYILQELGEWEFRGCRQDLSPIASSRLPSRSDLPWRGGHDLTPEEFPLWETLENAMGGDGGSVPCDHLLEQGALPVAGCEMAVGAPERWAAWPRVQGVTTLGGMIATQ